MTTLVVIGNGDAIRFLTLSCRCARSGHGTQGSQARLPRLFLYPPATSLLFFFFSCSFFSFSPGDVSWRHTASLDVIGLKYLEPSCSAGGRDLCFPTGSELLQRGLKIRF